MAGGRLQKHIPLLSPRQSMRQGLLLGADSEASVGGMHPTSGGVMASAVHKNNLGWVLGVVMPTILNALGVAFYLQYPYLVGLYGVLLLIAVLLVCQLTVFLTILSLSAVVTNGRVGGGGCYCTRERERERDACVCVHARACALRYDAGGFVACMCA